jgi:hypothetical protein
MTRPALGLLLSLALTACGGGTGLPLAPSGDLGSASDIARSADLVGADLAGVAPTGIACDKVVCGVDDYCIQEIAGTPLPPDLGQPPAHCESHPECRGKPTCACLTASSCPENQSGGTCWISGGVVTCAGY